MTVFVMPDVDQALVDYLATHPALTPLHEGRVGTSLQSDLISLRISALGGIQPWPWQATAEYQIESWGGTQGESNGLLRTVLAAVTDMRGPIPGGHITGTAIQLGPLWSPDEQTGRPRYLAQVAFTVHTEES